MLGVGFALVFTGPSSVACKHLFVAGLAIHPETFVTGWSPPFKSQSLEELYLHHLKPLQLGLKNTSPRAPVESKPWGELKYHHWIWENLFQTAEHLQETI